MAVGASHLIHPSGVEEQSSDPFKTVTQHIGDEAIQDAGMGEINEHHGPNDTKQKSDWQSPLDTFFTQTYLKSL